jgi:hypothetical protein
MLCILDLADLVLGKFGGVCQILLAHVSRKLQAAHVLRQDASRCMNVPPCHCTVGHRIQKLTMEYFL